LGRFLSVVVLSVAVLAMMVSAAESGIESGAGLPLWVVDAGEIRAIPGGLEMYMFAEGRIFLPGSDVNRRVLGASGLRWRELHGGHLTAKYGVMPVSVLRRIGGERRFERVALVGDMVFVLLESDDILFLREGRWACTVFEVPGRWRRELRPDRDLLGQDVDLLGQGGDLPGQDGGRLSLAVGESEEFQAAVKGGIEGLVQPYVDALDADSLLWTIQALQDFGTRYAYAENRREVAEWIRGRFLAMGFGEEEVYLDEFTLNGTIQYNVIAEIRGFAEPEQVIVIGGHHDSITPSGMTDAPGADDNASGTSAALEIARVMKAGGYVPDKTIRFGTWAAEELGLYGSAHYAERMKSEGETLSAYYNNDMISNNHLGRGMTWVEAFTGGEELMEFNILAIEQFTDIKVGGILWNQRASDHYSFYRNGFPAVGSAEYDFSPYYHSTEDLVRNIDKVYCREMTAITLVSAIARDRVPQQPGEYVLQDAGDGSTLILHYAEELPGDFEHFQVEVYQAGSGFQAEWVTTDTLILLEGLSEGVSAEVKLSIVDMDGNGSFPRIQTLEPRNLPRAPLGLDDTSTPEHVSIRWESNREADIAGYHIYRSETETESGVRLNVELIDSLSWTDISVESGILYYYRVAAEDLDGQTGDMSEAMTGRKLSFEDGVLWVNMFDIGTYSDLDPDSADVAAFTAAVLEGQRHQVMHSAEGRLPEVKDLGGYSDLVLSVNSIWFGEFEGKHALIEGLREFMSYGGNVFFNGFFPADVLSDAESGDPVYRDFLMDAFKVESSRRERYSMLGWADAVSLSLGDMAVNPERSLSYQGRDVVYSVDGLTAQRDAVELYAFGTEFDAGTSFGRLSGETIAVGYFGEERRAMLMSVPLYFFEEGEVRDLLAKLRDEGFTATSVDAAAAIEFRIESVYPNPFNASTEIRFQVPAAGRVDLAVYDLLGRELFSRRLETRSGENLFRWEGLNRSGQAVGSGIYLLRLQGETEAVTRKLVLLK